MGTNYYYHKEPPCKHCGRSDEPLHIGKSSGGWTFALHVDPSLGIENLDDWKRLFAVEGSRILDESGEYILVDTMLSIITDRSAWVRPGSAFSTEFLRQNHAYITESGLLARNRNLQDRALGLDYDLIMGDFS